jgi:N-acyl-D-amino-acid deacylase
VYDLLIRGGLLVDGDRDPWSGDVAIEGGRIAAVGHGLGAARELIDASGRLVAPGFVDIHTHSDFTLPLRPQAEAKLRQGVTTDVTGNCGFSPFPLASDVSALRHGGFIESELAERWPTLAAFGEELEGRGLGINVAPLVGLGAIRLAVLGEDDVPADPPAIEAMATLLQTALRDGAFGASSGLVYTPSSFADVDELSALARVVAEHGGIYATHMRSEGDRLADSVAEAIEVGRRSRCPVQISHLKALGRRNWGRVDAAIEQIEHAHSEGIDVCVDAYPYTAGSSTLVSLLPAGELDGGIEVLDQRLTVPSERARLIELLGQSVAYELDGVMLATVPSRPDLGGLRLVDAARAEGVAAAELVLQLIAVDGADVSMVAFGMAEEDVRRVLAHPRSIVASDGWTMSIDAAPYAHPRSFAYAVRLLASYVRDDTVLGLRQAIAKLSTLPARRIGLHDRGVLEQGAVADVVVLDLEALSEESTFAAPLSYPHGIEHVVVAGRHAVAHGALTEVRAGRVLRARRGARIRA